MLSYNQNYTIPTFSNFPLVNKSFCDILIPFVGCKSYEDLKSIIKEKTPTSDYMPREYFSSVRSILFCIQEEMIATRI